MSVRLTDPSDRVDEPDVHGLVARSHRSARSARQALEHYRSRSWRMLGYEAYGHVVAVIGFDTTEPGMVVIRALAVHEPYRRRGLARSLIRSVATRHAGATLVAETDPESVDFYRACGFTVASLGELYTGVERCRCVKTARETPCGRAPAEPGP